MDIDRKRQMRRRMWRAMALVAETGLVYDFFIDDVNGSDANDGASPATAWASLDKINDITLVSGATTRVLVKAGTYDKATDNVQIIAGAGVSNCTIEVTFQAGCAIDGTNYPANTNCLETQGTAGNYTNTFRFFGNGCTIRNITTATGNGLGVNNGGTGYFHGFDVRNCVDCSSSHGDGQAVYEDCYFGDATKSPCANIQTTNSIYRRCTFDNAADTATAGGLLITTQSPTQLFEDCIFLPGTTGVHRTLAITGTAGNNATFVRCQVGTLARSVTITGTASGATVVALTKCFVNAQHDANFTITYTRCFAKLSIRQRNLGAATVSHCIISGPATGFTNVFYSNFDPTAGSPHLVNNNIFEMGSAWMSYDATNAGYVVAAGSEFHNNILFGGAVYDADLIAADSGGTVIQGTITSDPLIGTAATLLMADYAFVAGSPAIGAATDDSDIGFGVAEVVERQIA